jgi:hypothetical protein
MHTYSCSGTLGDTYVNLCILYYVATLNPIVCRHYTVHKNWHKLIKQIYSLIPNIRVEFVNKRDTANPRIYSAFIPHRQFGTTLASPDEWCVFPQFVFPKWSDLPEHYVVLNPQSGRPDQGRILTREIIDRTIANSQYPVVVLGTSSVSQQIKGNNVLNLTNQTSLLEAMGIISRAQHVTTFQGLTSIVSASQRIQSSVYIRKVGDPCYNERVAPEWSPYHIIQEERL